MRTKIIANYLPQFHRTNENDEWWGEGYTDWTAVNNAVPLFDGHKQPRIPKDGCYDLSDPAVLKKQAELAVKYGITGFGIYHYWFSKEQNFLTLPCRLLLENKDIDIKFLFIWDNASWKRNWDNVKPGNEWDWAPLYEKNGVVKSGVLAELKYGSEKDWKDHFDYLLPFFKDERYIRIDGKPVFAFFHQDIEPECITKMTVFWDQLAKENGLPGIYTIGQTNQHDIRCAAYQFDYQPPRGGWTNLSFYDKVRNKLFSTNSRFEYDYDTIWKNILKHALKDIDKDVFYSGFVSYDDTPRRGRDKGRIVLGASPIKYERYLEELLKISGRAGKEYVFLTAWNEWGEGAYLEPDTEYGFSYLEATASALKKSGMLQEGRDES